MEAQAGSTQGKCFQMCDHQFFPSHPIPDTHPAKLNSVPLTDTTQAWLMNLPWQLTGLLSSAKLHVCVFIGDKDEVRGCWGAGQARLKVGEGNIDFAGGQKFQSGGPGFGLVTSYVTYDLLQGPSHEFIIVPSSVIT